MTPLYCVKIDLSVYNHVDCCLLEKPNLSSPEGLRNWMANYVAVL